MATGKANLKVVTPAQLAMVMTAAKTDTALRDQLIKAPAAALEARGLQPTARLVDFFSKLTPENFDQEISKAHDAVSHPLVVGEASIGEAGI
jgi:hypothetical protein